jgi:hypothetical protein
MALLLPKVSKMSDRNEEFKNLFSKYTFLGSFQKFHSSNHLKYLMGDFSKVRLTPYLA